MAANSLIKLYRLDNKQRLKIRQKTPLDVYHDNSFIPYPRLPGLADNVDRYGPEDIRTTASLGNEAVSFVNKNKGKLSSFYGARYEDILTNPEEEILKIFEFCELPGIGKGESAFWEKISQIGVTHHKNIYGDFEVVESICLDNMQKYGYL